VKRFRAEVDPAVPIIEELVGGDARQALVAESPTLISWWSVPVASAVSRPPSSAR
jgi:hypothetical protein